jgi:tetratricopeptide (TPR) repeat protein
VVELLMADAYRVPDSGPDLSETLCQAVEFQRQGRLEDAERYYGYVLDQSPGHADALHFLGVLHHQRGHAAEALGCVAAALKSNPMSAEILANYAFMLDTVGLSAEAVAAYDRILIIRPNDVDALCNRGNAQTRLGRLKQAVKSFEDALAIRPDHAGALNGRGTALRKLGQSEEALVSFQKLLAIRPDDVAALDDCATALQVLGRHSEALGYCDKAIAIDPDRADLHCNRGHSLRELARLDQALASFEAALAADPAHVSSHHGRGKVLRELRRYEEAIASYDAALAIEPEHADALCDRGNALADLLRLEEAAASFCRAVAINPKSAAAFNGLGMALTLLRRDEEALESFKKAAALKPADPEINFNEGVARLRAGDFACGWLKYEQRLQLPGAARARSLDSEPWRGQTSLRGRTILLHGEGDISDTLQFVRYVGPAVAAGARVLLEVEPELTTLMTGIAGVSAVVGRGERVPPHELNCPLPSLPLAFAASHSTIPSAIPYLRAPAQRVQAWTSCLSTMKSPLVGFLWSTDHSDRKQVIERSIALAQFARLLEHASARFVSLQADAQRDDVMLLAQQPNVTKLGAELRGFVDVAAIVSLLDLVITVDAPVAHLAGALGRPVWVLLPYRSDYRWMVDCDDSPWYPTAKLFRQPAAGDWDSVVAAVCQALAGHSFSPRAARA